MSALIVSWSARDSAWVNKLHDFLISNGFDAVEDLWLLANGVKQNKHRMVKLYAKLVQHMSFKDADHEKMEYLLDSIPHPRIAIATTLKREPLSKPTAIAPSKLQCTPQMFADRLVSWCKDTKDLPLASFIMDKFSVKALL